MRLPQPSLAINEGSVAQLLDAEEFRRWRRFAFCEDAQRFLAGRAFLRITLGAVLGVPPRELAFSTGTFGKPSLAATGTDRLRFSLSRTSHAIALALAGGVDVGVDIEHLVSCLANIYRGRGAFAGRVEAQKPRNLSEMCALSAAPDHKLFKRHNTRT